MIYTTRSGGVPFLLLGLLSSAGIGVVASTDIGQELTGSMLRAVFEAWSASAASVLPQIFDALPIGSFDYGFILPYLSFLDYFFPVNFALVSFTAYLAFVCTFISVKLILKIIPGIG